MPEPAATPTTMLADVVPTNVMDNLQRLSMNGCTCSCLASSRELRRHGDYCTYRLACEVIDTLATTPAPQGSP